MFDSQTFLPYISSCAGTLAIYLMAVPFSVVLLVVLARGPITRMFWPEYAKRRQEEYAKKPKRWVVWVECLILVMVAMLWYVFGLLPSEFARRATARGVADVFQIAHRNKSGINMRIEGVKSIAIAVEDTNGQRIEASLMVSDLADISRAIYEGKISKGDISWPDHGEQKK